MLTQDALAKDLSNNPAVEATYNNGQFIIDNQEFKSAFPIGGIIRYPNITPPEGWVNCLGGELPIASYPELFAVIGYAHGIHTEGYFRIPNQRYYNSADVAGTTTEVFNAKMTTSTGGGRIAGHSNSISASDTLSISGYGNGDDWESTTNISWSWNFIPAALVNGNKIHVTGYMYRHTRTGAGYTSYCNLTNVQRLVTINDQDTHSFDITTGIIGNVVTGVEGLFTHNGYGGSGQDNHELKINTLDILDSNNNLVCRIFGNPLQSDSSGSLSGGHSGGGRYSGGSWAVGSGALYRPSTRISWYNSTYKYIMKAKD